VSLPPSEAGLSLFETYSPVLMDESAPSVRDRRLLIDSDGNIAIYYVPFEYINPQARIVLVGITPGPTQMVNGNMEARRALLSGKSTEEAMESAKKVAAFSGEPMRGNLIRQMNHWGFHKWLGIDGCGELFGTQSNLVQTTSLLRYPVFVGGKDYRGSPDMTRNPLLKKHLFEYFVEEVNSMPDALFVSLGPKVQQVLDRLVEYDVLDSRRIIKGLLHPSGNNTYRINYLVGQRETPVPHMTNRVPYDQGREAFRKNFVTR
jgi:hypothetical protein